MAVNMSLKIKGIDGESPIKGHEKEIEVLSFSIGATQSATAHHGTGSTAGKANIQDLSITKRVDKSSPLLFGALCKGSHLEEAVLTCEKSSGDKSIPYLKITLSNALVSSTSTGASSSDDVVLETVTLNFAKIKKEYTPQGAKGTPEGAVTQTWDVAKNAES
ncbi:MAG: type VI secretion system tube protein Hcp [Polyangiaceae bacterium]|nr:type VI secretion system tube protein Hcp [Polyangiaceae bacterium]